MIAKDYITAWRAHVPWVSDHQVEQDLVISRALAQVFSVAEIGRRLAFRGGTALYKLYLRPATRYSEDIDLVQVAPEPIGDTLNGIRSVLDRWLGIPRRDLKEGRVSLVYRFSSEDQPPKALRLRLEINSREHFAEHGHVRVPFEVKSEWWSGKADVTTFSLDELPGTKLRSLNHRPRQRDHVELVDHAPRSLACASPVAFRRASSQGPHREGRRPGAEVRSMDVLQKHEISEAEHRILNPIDEQKLMLLGEVCRLRAGQRQLDLACGKGEMLCRWSARFGIEGLGVDISEVFLDAARKRAAELGVASYPRLPRARL